MTLATTKAATQKTAVIYARYSTDKQNDRSIEDQFADGRQIAKRDGFRIVGEISDRAKSSATLEDRDALNGFVQDQFKASNRVTAIIVENTDRISRDPIDLTTVYRKLAYNNVEIRTGDGVANKMYIQLRGIFGEMFMENLSNASRRGGKGRVREGKVPGSIKYGYSRAENEPGVQMVDEEKAKIVRRIFKDYAKGDSPDTIAQRLTADGVPSPTGGRVWSRKNIVSGGGKFAMIDNPIYIGEIVWNATKRSRHPVTGKKIQRPTPESEWLRVAAPHLRIVSQELWDAANKVRLGRGVKKLGGGITRRPMLARKDYLLKGLLHCAKCDGPMRITNSTGFNGGSRVGCSVAHHSRTCAHRKSYDLAKLEERVLEAVNEQCAKPDALEAEARAFHEELAKAERGRGGEITKRQKRVAEIGRTIDRLIRVAEITEGDQVTEIGGRIKELARERDLHNGWLKNADALGGRGNVLPIHGRASTAFKANLTSLQAAARKSVGELSEGERIAIRNAVAKVVVHETARGEGYLFDLFARYDALVGVNLFPKDRDVAQIVAAQGLSKQTNATLALASDPLVCSAEEGRIVHFGRFQKAA